jgi:hypothetical protein
MRVVASWMTGDLCAVPGVYSVMAGVRIGHGAMVLASRRPVAIVAAVAASPTATVTPNMPMPGHLPYTGGGPRATARDQSWWALACALIACLLAARGALVPGVRRRRIRRRAGQAG